MVQASIEIPSHDLFVEPVLSFISSYLKKLGVFSQRYKNISEIIEKAIFLVIKKDVGVHAEHFIKITVFGSDGKLIIKILNSGAPVLTSDLARLLSSTAQNKDIGKYVDKFSLENLGRLGQAITLEIKLGQETFSTKEAAPVKHNEELIVKEEDFEVRLLREGEEGSLSRLFYFVYGYDYINEFVYYPEKIKKMIRDGNLISVVAALKNGKLLGHGGLQKWNDAPPIYEPCLGITDPTVKSKGLFKKIFKKSMEIAGALDMQYCFFDFVTNHDYSQRLVAKYGTCDMAIFAGCQTSKTQAKLERLGIGKDPIASDRYSILLSITPGVPYPFGKELFLPNNIGEMFGFLLKPLNIAWFPASRFNTLDQNGEYEMHLEPAQQSVVFDFVKPGFKAAKSIVNDWHELMKEGYQYAAVDVELSEPGLGQLYDFLSGHGFFVSGFIPYRRSDKLGFRFQALAPTKVDFSEIKVYSKTAKKLLEVIKSDYERNCIT